MNELDEFTDISDKKLESMWQGQAGNIQIYMFEYYKTNDKKFKKMAQVAQERQQVIQQEITRRSN